MNTPATLALLLLLSSFTYGAAAEATPKDTIGHPRLAAAYAHVHAASDLARGTLKPFAVYTADAKGLTNTQLRKEIGLRADRVLTDFHKTPPLQRIDVAAHLDVARLKLTSKTETDIDAARKRIADIAKQSKGRAGFNPEEIIRKGIRDIHAALQAP